MTNPLYGAWEQDDADSVGWSEYGEPYVRPTHRGDEFTPWTYPPDED